jgi:hypothetical protein
VDWGLNTLLSAGAARLNGDTTITALGAGARYRANGVAAKAHRLRRQGERLHARHDQLERLAAGDSQHPLTRKAAVLAEEHRRVSQRRSRLNDALACSAARRQSPRPAPGDAGHPPRHRDPAADSVRRDAPQRPSRHGCPAQPAAGTRARTRSAPPPSGARTGHAGRHSALASTSTPTPPHPDGSRQSHRTARIPEDH